MTGREVEYKRWSKQRKAKRIIQHEQEEESVARDWRPKRGVSNNRVVVEGRIWSGGHGQKSSQLVLCMRTELKIEEIQLLRLLKKGQQPSQYVSKGSWRT
ncbi:hypothetical protein SAY86_031284 [Trapa natans]|uniref:Uncharacterized protein n=1 Tax=Trapa natans TaxID=22666 RepID=A0AAN7LQY2_TRANT|nr:hypothetical protein SAY86_031284 [Trapa natans]